MLGPHDIVPLAYDTYRPLSRRRLMWRINKQEQYGMRRRLHRPEALLRNRTILTDIQHPVALGTEPKLQSVTIYLTTTSCQTWNTAMGRSTPLRRLYRREGCLIPVPHLYQTTTISR